jgi:hypothetical protein
MIHVTATNCLHPEFGMSSLFKPGIAFVAIGLLATFAAAFIPYVGIYFGAPLAAVCAGAGAGYFSARHEAGRRALNLGIAAGGITGAGALFSPLLFVMLLVALLRAKPPAFYAIIRTYYVQADEWMSAELVLTIMSQYALASSLCYGIINLLGSVAGGMLGSWAAARKRSLDLAPPTSRHDQSRPHPRVFVWLCGATIFVILFLYSLLILFPSYQSGIYRSEHPDQENFLVPFYTDDASGLVNTSTLIWSIWPLIDLSAIFIFPPLSIALLAVLIRKWRLFTARERTFWVAALMIVWIGFVVTFPAAMKFGVWYAD